MSQSSSYEMYSEPGAHLVKELGLHGRLVVGDTAVGPEHNDPMEMLAEQFPRPAGADFENGEIAIMACLVDSRHVW